MLIQRFSSFLAANPTAFHYLRKLPEFNYTATKVRIRDWLSTFNGVVLDLGCGTGEFSSLFPASRYIGVDINLPYLKFAKNSDNRLLICANGSFLPLQNSTVDAVLINGVVHHLDDSAAKNIFSEVRRIVKPSSSILLIEDIPSSQPSVITSLVHWLDEGDFIRKQSDYEELFHDIFQIKNSECFRSRVCTYSLWKLRPLA